MEQNTPPKKITSVEYLDLLTRKRLEQGQIRSPRTGNDDYRYMRLYKVVERMIDVELQEEVICCHTQEVEVDIFHKPKNGMLSVTYWDAFPDEESKTPKLQEVMIDEEGIFRVYMEGGIHVNEGFFIDPSEEDRFYEIYAEAQNETADLMIQHLLPDLRD